MAKKTEEEVPVEKVGVIRAPQDIGNKGPVHVGGVRPAPRAAADGLKGNTPDLPPSEMEPVEILCDEEIVINGKRFFGRIIVKRHEARSILPMIQAKKRTDIEVYTGKNFLVKRGVDNRLIVKEVSEDQMPGKGKG